MALVVDRILCSAAAVRGAIAEVLVVNDDSTDRTLDAARRTGARVVSTRDVLEMPGRSRGKGDAMWAALRVCQTDLCVFIDADVTRVSDSFALDLIEPIVRRTDVRLVKGSFKRMSNEGLANSGRLTTLTARPLLSVLNPTAARFKDPLSGLFCAETQMLRNLRLERDYGVDIGIFLDVGEKFGFESIVEVDLGVLSHLPRDLDDLGGSAAMICRAILIRNRGEMSIPKEQLPAVRSVSGRAETRHDWTSRSPVGAFGSCWIDGVGVV